jgi:beta-lactamase regulating signal transducer with metallopeptidase domain
MNALDGYFSLGALVAAKTTLLLLAAFALSFLARKTSASARHVLWALTFVFLLLIPGMAYVSSVQQEVSIPIAVLSPEPEIAQVVPAARAMASSLPAPRVRNEPGPEPPTPEASSTSIPWSFLAGSLWAAGTLLLVSRLVLGLVSSRRVLAESEPVYEPDWTDLLDGARQRLDVRQSVALRLSDRVPLPMTLGLFRPTILLPSNAEEYAMSRRSAVILHELAHVRRRDCGSQLVSALAAAAFWWNPLVWIACRHMRLLSERASDDLVLDAGARPSDYAHDLLEMARGLHKEWATPLGSVTMAHRSRFEERLLAILDPRVARKAASSRFVLVAGLGASPLVLSLALAVPTAATPPPRAAVPKAEEPETPLPPEPAASAQEPQEPQEPEEPKTAKERAALEVAKAALAEALDDPEALVREQALNALVQIGDRSVAPYLEKALADENPRARAQAAWGLGQMRREESVASLVGALSDVDEEVREQAAWALGMIRDPRAVAGLNAAVRDAEESVRAQVVWALGMIRSRESVDGLVTALSDSSPDVRGQAAWALGMIRDSRAVEALSRALKDEAAEVREQAAWALGLIVQGGDDEDDEERPDPDPPNQDPTPDDGLDAGIDPEPGSARFGTGAIR